MFGLLEGGGNIIGGAFKSGAGDGVKMFMKVMVGVLLLAIVVALVWIIYNAAVGKPINPFNSV